MQCHPTSMNGSYKQSFKKDKKDGSNEHDYNNSYRKAKLMAAFLKHRINMYSKKESYSLSRRWIDPFSAPPTELEALAISKITYDDESSHFYRQKYLAVYNSMKKFNSDQDKFIKNKIHNWFRIKNSKEQYRSKSKKIIAEFNNNDKLSLSKFVDIASSFKVFFCYFNVQ
ncbi:hypothetical protein S83_020828 [Arachis hypogaea]